ncbi:TRAP transporter substrate-binding protein [Xenophilus arseniciresistens]|uniref:TRAP transporter substrate-binding protein n=1 Tax=Xenophilus arseniciresistens TaxID=1283306 RepID=A0AAE3NAN4_9BURK|nr:TRAP transporter substrate-binding protein [Xenophilus arseniciresistens]MDA7418156.1 TRAP transporter substrate-binding protein [Xenophilus arseniciresistens]
MLLPAVLSPAWSQEPSSLRLRVVGGLAGVNQYKLEERFWASDLARLSQGRYSASIVPFNKAGVPGTEMLNLMKLGVIPMGTALLSQVSTDEPDFAAPDLAGLNPDMATLRRVVSAYRPTLSDELERRFNIQLLAVYVYPAQMIFCRNALQQLSDLRGRRIRVSGQSQADFVHALEATPVTTEFADIISNISSASTDCAITGSMSGHVIGLHRYTSYLYALPINWGLGVFGVNRDAWKAMPADLRTLVHNEIPKLEDAVWKEAERETWAGVACNSGVGECPGGAAGRMTVVNPSPADRRQLEDIFRQKILPRWIQRCGANCTALWEQTIGTALGARPGGRP